MFESCIHQSRQKVALDERALGDGVLPPPAELDAEFSFFR
jgi:hypothetical protein